MGETSAGMPALLFSRESDRRSFLRTATTIGVGAAMVAGGALAATPALADDRSDDVAPGDIDLLTFALSIEYLESDYYNAVLKNGPTTTTVDARKLLTDGDLSLLTAIAEHETEHVATVTATLKSLGGQPPAWPKVTYPAETFASRAAILQTAWQYEELGVKAYHGMVPLISDPALLATLASIAGSESRHAAILSTLADGNPFPAAVEAAASKSAVLAKIAPLMVY